jgi:uncharacterized protein (TIGR02145 family)
MKQLKILGLLYICLVSFACDKDSSTNPDCVGSFTDTRDGEVYATAVIGFQCWITENMRFEMQGDLVNPMNPDSKYGRLYTQSQALTVCPLGFHLPSDDEWITLERFLGMSETESEFVGSNRGSNEAGVLKSTSGWSNLNGSNDFGFNALPAGANINGNFQYLGDNARFWSKTSSGSSSAYSRVLFHHSQEIARFRDNVTYSYSCRCLRD